MAAGQPEASSSKAPSDTEGELPEQAEPGSLAGDGLTDDQLMEVFKQTSIFNVKSALANNQNLMQNETAEDQEQDFFSDSDISDTDEWDYLRGFWSGEAFSLGPKASEPSGCLLFANHILPVSDAQTLVSCSPQNLTVISVIELGCCCWQH